MEIWEQISRQRVKYIVSSYQLEGREANQFNPYLERLLQSYPLPLIELALVETLVDRWTSIPMTKGLDFLSQTHNQLRDWESQPIVSTLTPEQFQQITGLDPSPVFGAANLPSTRSIGQPL
jgi:hypothetical protein